MMTIFLNFLFCMMQFSNDTYCYYYYPTLINLQLFEKPDESEVACQTDYYLDRPATPPFCPSKTGEDVATQIEPGDVSRRTKKTF